MYVTFTYGVKTCSKQKQIPSPKGATYVYLRVFGVLKNHRTTDRRPKDRRPKDRRPKNRRTKNRRTKDRRCSDF
jgi:hypothetical protein